MSKWKTGGLGTAVDVVKDASKSYGRHFGSRMAAAISYRTVFALAPMLVIAVSIAGFVLGGDAEAQAAIIQSVTEIAGEEVASFLEQFLQGALESANTAALIGVVVLLWSSSTLFLELQRSLNQIFDVDVEEVADKRLFVMLIQRSIGILWTVGIGLALLALFAANAMAQIAGDAISEFLNIPAGVVGALGFVVTLAFMVLMFGLVFQTLTLQLLPWRPVWMGALFTSVSFSIAGYGTGLYFKIFDEPTALGVTGSIVVLLFLAYVLSSVFLVGAEVTQSYRLLVYDVDAEYLLFSDIEAPRDGPEQGKVAVSITALGAFLLGLLIGRRR